MKKIMAWFDPASGSRTTTLEIEDNATYNEIEAAVKEWIVSKQCAFGWTVLNGPEKA